MITNKGQRLSFVKKTTHSHLFVLPTSAMLAQNRRLTMNDLIKLLPELQNMFSIIIIDAPPLTHADTPLLARQPPHTALLVKTPSTSLNPCNMSYILSRT